MRFDPGRIDRRIIFLLVFLAVAIPMLFRIHMPFTPTPPVRAAFQAIDTLPPGSVILISTDYGPGTMPEVDPMVRAVVRHAFSKGHRILLMSTLDALGLALGDQAVRTVAAEMGKQYGTDWVNLGFKPGFEAVIVSMGKNIRDIFPEDYAGRPLDSLPLTQNIRTLRDIALAVDFASGAALQAWIQFAQARFGVPLVGGVTAVMAPENYPYLNSGQLLGLIGGLKGAAEYELLLHRPGVATAGMPAQSFVHLLIILLIALGNLGYFLQRRRRT